MKRFVFVLSLIGLVTLAFVARCWPLREVFVQGRIYFTDPDCYSRMTRVKMIAEGRAWIIKHHSFENHPQGTKPHTTSPMDFAIVALSKTLKAGFGWFDQGNRSVLGQQSIDLAGALVGPLLGVFACVAAALGLPRNEPGERWRNVGAAALLMGISPIVVHGTLLGRPDHQALLVPLLVVAIALEFRLLRSVSQKVAVASGIAWGLALWVSLYEPLVLLALLWIGLAIFQPAVFRERERLLGWSAAVGLFFVSVLIDGWRLQPLDADLRATFARWSRDIGELKHLDLSGPTFWTWVGYSAVLAPVALGWLARQRLDARIALWLLLCTFGLTLWQVRWGYFFVLIFALSLPVQMVAVKRQWIGWTLLLVGLWPVLGWWDSQLYPDEPESRRRVGRVEEQIALRNIAEQQGARKAGAFIAPWWLSPAIAYWSGQPGTSGSSHESLPGIADSARVYLAPNAASALPIIRQRQVQWILSEAPDRIIPVSARILGVPEPAYCLANQLDSRIELPTGSPVRIEREIERMPGRDFFQVWRVEP